jgi:hypothetical protein
MMPLGMTAARRLIGVALAVAAEFAITAAGGSIAKKPRRL